MTKKILLVFISLIFSAYSSFAMAEDDDVKEACRLLVLKEEKDYTSWGGTPLHAASTAKERRTDMIEFLVEKEGADIRHGDQIERLPIHVAAWGGYIDSVEWFLKKDKDLINMKSAGGWTPLHQAVGGGRPEIVELLLNFGASTDGRVDCNNTLMHIAAQGDMRKLSSYSSYRYKERQACARILAARGVNPGLVNDVQETPAQLARKRGFDEMAVFFESLMVEFPAACGVINPN